MTKKATIFVLVFMTTFLASAQVFEITPSYGYQFGAKLGYGPNYLKLDDSGQFGVTVGVETYSGLMVEFTYLNMSSELRLRDVVFAPFETKLSDLNVDWFMIGATRYFKTGKVKPFAGGNLGLVVVSPSNENREIVDRGLQSTTKFAFSFKAGVNIMFTESIGLNLQGNLYFPVDWAGVYVDSGGAGISTGSTVILGGFSGGLVFRIDAN